MTKKNEPKIRIVTLNKKSANENTSNKGCHCEGDDNCPECRVQPMCSCDGVCKCHDKIIIPECKCDLKLPCVVDPPSCRTVIPTKESNNQLEQQTLVEGKEKPRTFFKIGKNKISD